MRQLPAYDRHVITERHAGLDFSLLLPSPWRLECPAQPQGDARGQWVELGRARPAAAAGADRQVRVTVSGLSHTRVPTLEDAMRLQLRQRLVRRHEMRPLRMGRHVGLGLTTRAGSDDAPLLLRLALIEDGGRLLRLMLQAPPGHPVLAPGCWAAMAGGLVLHGRDGPTLPVLRGDAGMAPLRPAETFETRARAA